MACTKPTAQELLIAPVFSEAVCDELIAWIKTFELPRWFYRGEINSRPTQGTKEAHYWFCGDRQQPKDFNQYLRSLAPEIPGVTLAEACINWYQVGSYMPEHIDVCHYMVNMVVNLNDAGDGVEVAGVFHPDVKGRGVVFPAFSPPHRVPPVKNERYVIIYLYE